MRAFMWLYPGLKVKRWFLVALAGAALAGSGMAVLLNTLPLAPFWLLVWRVLYLWGLKFSSWGGALLVVAGAGMAWLGFSRMMASIVRSVLPNREERLVELLYHKRHLERGPRLVAIGGGTGLAALLRGLKEYTSNITAIVTVADDGGSSGRLRGQLGVLPPGDVRNCLVALADTESLMEEVVGYRFGRGDVAGHSLGNLLLAALSDITGDMERAVQEVSKVLAIRGRVLPCTLDDVRLVGEKLDGSLVEGESNISQGGQIRRVKLEPCNCKALPEALQAIREADAVILGPGSLYTSIIPNLLLDGMQEALRQTRGRVYYVCNIMTQPGETDGYTASDHLRAIREHAGPGLVDFLLVNVSTIPTAVRQRYRQQKAVPVAVDTARLERLGVQVLKARLVEDGDLVRHDPARLARALLTSIVRQQPAGQRLRGWNGMRPTG